MKLLLLASGLVLISGRLQRCNSSSKRWCHSGASLQVRGGSLDDVLSPAADTIPDTAIFVEGVNGDVSSSSPLQQRSPRFLGFTVSDLKSSAASRSAQVGIQLKKQLDVIRKSHASMSLPKIPDEWKGRSSEAIQHVAPVALAAMQLLYHNGDISFLGVYALALLGSSSGFHLFLYFITVGYALGVVLPVSVALCLHSVQRSVKPLTTVHSGLTILWGIRSAAFFLYREYVNWPQLHNKVVEVNKLAGLNSKVFCWLVYSLCYATMASPCLYRLQSGKSWDLFGKIALGIQATGLLLEAVADYQKSTFKSLTGNRNQWCNVGLFRYSTFPNYLGELLFWYGNFLAGMASFQKPREWTLSILGVLFITFVVRGAMHSLGTKQMRRYGSTNPGFVNFVRTHTIVGPVPSLPRRSKGKTVEAVEQSQPAF